MTAFIVATLTIKDAARFQEYSQGLAETLAAFEGQPLARGKVLESLKGSVDHAMVGVVAFPSVEQAKAWFTSDAYQALAPVRDAAADVNMTLCATP